MTVDNTKSKRPIKTEINDIPRLQEDLTRIGDSLLDCEDLAMALGLDKEYEKVVAMSHARMIEIFEKSCKVPMTEENLTYHAEVRGRMSERLRLTLELQSIKKQISIFERIRLNIEKTVARILEKGKKENDD